MKSKLVLFLTTFLISLSAFSANLNIICERPGIDTSNQFDLVGVIVQDSDDTYISGVFSITTRKQGNDSVESQGVIETSGTIKTYAEGAMGVEEVVHVQYVNKGANLEYISIVGNHPGPLSSSIRFNDGTTFKSQCIVK